MKRKNLGITLISLVITIIILLILAGITISSLTNSGLFDKVKEAKEKNQNAQGLENSILDDYNEKINFYSRTNGISNNVIFDSVANTKKQSYTLTDSIEKYDFIEVYAKAYYSGNVANKNFLRIPVSEIDLGSETEFMIGAYWSSGWNFAIEFGFTSNNSFYYNSNTVSGWNGPEIYKIVGYKY